MTRFLLPALLLAASLLPAAAQQTAVPVGKGSYADSPPLNDRNLAEKYNRDPHIDPSLAGTPIPTNDWCTDLFMEGGDGGQLWAYPDVVQFDTQGVAVSYPTAWNDRRGPMGIGVELSSPLRIAWADPGAQPQTNVLKWGDWTLVARQSRSPQEYWDVTFGNGLPFVWFEGAALKPLLRADKNGTFTVTKLDGSAFSGGQTDAFLIQISGDNYGVFGPSGMSVTIANNTAQISFTPAVATAIPKPWLAIGVLPDPKLAPLFHSAAAAIPRDSRFTWQYNPVSGNVDTTYQLITEALRYDAGAPLQGWLPHHFHAAANDIKPVGTPFLTPRGPLLLSQSATTHISWAFPGVLPFLPPPAVNAQEKSPYDPARMKGYIAAVADKRQQQGKNIGDTYWGGKMIQKTAQYAAIAAQTGDPSAQALHDAACGYLADFLTYSGPGDKYYFAHYPKWGGMVGFPGSYGSEFFTDNHFHYGYFTMSAGIMGALDPQFAKDYGPMARMVARQYANWDRNDKIFPFLRTFNPWTGHSYAGGSSSKGGNNQESSSESMNAWGGLVLLGSAMGDANMLSCGAMGYSIESEAIRCYWNNYYGWRDGASASTWPASYQRAIIGILGDSGGVFGTFFSGAPQHVFGIEWLPDSPALYYLGLDPKFVRYQYDQLMSNLSQEKKETTLEQIGADWGSLVLGYLAYGDPEAAAEKFDQLWQANDPIAHGSEETGIIYYLTHNGIQNGTIAPGWHTNIPTGTVFHKDNKITAIIWNASKYPVTAQVIQGSKVMKSAPAAPRSLTTITVP